MGLDCFVMEYVGMKVGLIRAEHAKVAFGAEPWHTRSRLLMWTFTKLAGVLFLYHVLFDHSTEGYSQPHVIQS